LAIVITGNSLLDAIILSILTGGGVISLLSLFLDRLSKKRADYISINNQKIERFSKAELYYVQLASYYSALSSLLRAAIEKKENIDYDLCIWFICNILYLLHKFHKEIGIVQLNNAYVEQVIYELMVTIFGKLLDPKFDNKLKYPDLYRLRESIDENTTYDAFHAAMEADKTGHYSKVDKWLKEVEEKADELLDLERKSRWYSRLIYFEMTMMYEIYYGKHHIQQFFEHRRSIDKDLLDYLAKNNPYYRKRLSKLIGRNRFRD
jgi:hypothetical protein